MRTISVLLLLSGAAPWLATRAAGAEQDKVVIPFDFESEFDGGRYGRIVGDMIWKKLDQRGRFVIPETMLDVRDWAQRKGVTPNPDTPLEELRRYVRDDFGADIAVWGKIERAPGREWDVYDFTIIIADFSVDPPRIVHRKTVRTKTVSEIPHVYVKEALDRLYGVQPQGPAPPDPQWDERWRSGPNLVQGDFEQGAPGPAGWDPLPPHVARVAVRDEQGRTNHIIRFTLPKDVAASTGVLYYSDYFPVEEGARYRFQCRWRSTGSSVKVFVKCYDKLDTKYSAGRGRQERREVYRSQQNLKGPPRQWNVHTQDFTPQHPKYTPRWGRVMLYAYWPAGVVDWDDVVLKQIAPPGDEERQGNGL